MRRKKVTDIGKLWKRQDRLKRNGFTKVISIPLAELYLGFSEASIWNYFHTKSSIIDV